MTSNILSSPETLTRARSGIDYRYLAGAKHDIVARLPFDPTASVLEIGCGRGETGALAIAQNRVRRYVGIEALPERAARAQEELSEVIVGDVEAIELEFLPAEFDAVVLSDIVQHLREPAVLLRRLHRFVRPGGLVLASSPNFAHWKIIRELLLGRSPQPGHSAAGRADLHRFTPECFAGLFERTGYDVVSCGPVRRFSQKQRLAARLLGNHFQHLLMDEINIEAVRR